jgi:hypothetical protein
MLPVYSPGGTRVGDIPPEPRSRVRVRPRGSRPGRLVGLGSKAAMWYDGGMTRDQVKEILDRVLTWPTERQADVAHMVEMMEAQDNSGLRLSDEQVAEVKRRVADPNPTFLTLEQVRERFAQRRA